MSGITGYLLSSGVDLSYVFQRRTSTQITNVGLYNYDGVDLSSLFEPLGSGTALVNLTGYQVNVNGEYLDLTQLFLPIILPFTYTGSPTTTSLTGYNTVLTFTGAGTIRFSSSNTINILIIGGGGGGGAAAQGSSSAAGGGGAGGVGQGSFNAVLNITYTIGVGTGGTGMPPYSTNNRGGTGGQTSLTGDTVSITATGGGGGGSAAQQGGGGGSSTGGSFSTTAVGSTGGVGTATGATITYNTGFKGAVGVSNGGGGGGGGSSSIGTAASGTSGGAGGTGTTWTVNSIKYAGGGGGGATGTGTVGAGKDGGGNGGSKPLTTGYNGFDGTTFGSGGGGGGKYGSQPITSGGGGDGMSGVVILAFNV
jgi:hypothetical protein